MKILFVSDDLHILKYVEYQVNKTIRPTQFDVFRQFEFSDCVCDINFDLIIIDLDTIQLNDVDILKMIRSTELHRHTSLILISSDHSFEKRLNAYEQHECYRYFTKPLNALEFNNCLGNIKNKLAHTLQRNFFIHHNRLQMVKVPLFEILYFEIFNKSCELYTITNHITMNRYPLSKVVEAVPETFFIQTHRSYVVNLYHVIKVELIDKNWYCYLSHGDIKIPVGKKYIDPLKKYMFTHNN